MADLKQVLGVLLATGLAGRSSKGAALAAAAPVMFGKGAPGGGWSLTQKAGLAALAYLAYRAYRDGKIGSAPAAGPATGSGTTTLPASAGKPGGLLDNLSSTFGGLFSGGSKAAQPTPAIPSGGLGDRLAGSLWTAAAPAAIDDTKALLLIRAMVAAANADGEISAEERHAILSRLDAAGAGPEEHRIVEAELRTPCSIDALVREVRDPDTAAEVYLASTLAIRVDTEAERAYLQYLASRLNLTPDQRQELDRLA
jgi:uncharacterized membrane protein YebE (DUF533 family)